MALMLGSASPAPATTEQELIEAARVGDDRAFEELYARYRERIGIFIRSRLRDHSRVEDVAQEVFISALRRLRSTDQEVVFKPWIYEIAKNACIDEYRRSQRRCEVSLDADAELFSGQGALLSIAPTPPAAMESKQRLDDLRGAFGGLSKSHHQLLVMREFEGLSYDEIGRRTGMSRQMVESALFRARRKLGAEYEELASGRRCLQVQTAIEAGKLTSRRSLGVRERRQLARHLAHCQPCRVKAHLAGVDDSFVRSGFGAKIAALLPFPALHWWPFGRAARIAARTGPHPGLGAAASAIEPGTSALLSGAAVAVALAIAGSGVPAAPGVHHPAPLSGQPGSFHAAPLIRPALVSPWWDPGAGPALSSQPLQGLRRVTGLSAVAGTAPRPRPWPRGGQSSPAAAPGSRGSSSTTKLPVSAGSPIARSGGSVATGAVQRTVGTVQRTVGTVQQAAGTLKSVVQSTTKSVGKAIAQTPVAKTVAKVFSTGSILNSPSSGHGGSGSSGVAPAPATGLPTASSAVGNASGTVPSVTKKLTDGVGGLLNHH